MTFLCKYHMVMPSICCTLDCGCNSKTGCFFSMKKFLGSSSSTGKSLRGEREKDCRWSQNRWLLSLSSPSGMFVNKKIMAGRQLRSYYRQIWLHIKIWSMYQRNLCKCLYSCCSGECLPVSCKLYIPFNKHCSLYLPSFQHPLVIKMHSVG